jgi:hypothetical protein
MTEQMPKDMTVRLRQMAASCDPIKNSGNQITPKWWVNLPDHHLNRPWVTLLSSAADELEQMQQLNGRLLRRLAGD